MSPTNIKTTSESNPHFPQGSICESHGVEVLVACVYDGQHSQPEKSHYCFVYNVTITNNRSVPIQILGREWEITHAQGQVDYVRGIGVVGQQPQIKPGHSYTYTSGCALKTPFGIMEGSYFVHSLPEDGGTEPQENAVDSENKLGDDRVGRLDDQVLMDTQKTSNLQLLQVKIAPFTLNAQTREQNLCLN